MHTQRASSSAQPMTEPSAIIIGPTVLASRPGDVFSNLLALLPDSGFYHTDHLSCLQEDADHIRVRFSHADSASKLATYWPHKNPLRDTVHNLSVRVADEKLNALAALFGQGN